MISYTEPFLAYTDYLRADLRTNPQSVLPARQMSRFPDTGSLVSMQMATCSAMMTEDIR